MPDSAPSARSSLSTSTSPIHKSSNAILQNSPMEIDNLLPSLVYVFSAVTDDYYCTYAAHVLATGPASPLELCPAVAASLCPHHCTQVQKWDWAHVIDMNRPMKNFNQLVPDMAHKVGRRFDAPPLSFTSHITLTLTCCAYTLVSLWAQVSTRTQ